MNSFNRTQVGFDNYGRPLYEHRLDGTSVVVVRMDPERNRGWAIHDEDRGVNVSDAWHLVDAKALAIRYAEEETA